MNIFGITPYNVCKLLTFFHCYKTIVAKMFGFFFFKLAVSSKLLLDIAEI